MYVIEQANVKFCQFFIEIFFLLVIVSLRLYSFLPLLFSFFFSALLSPSNIYICILIALEVDKTLITRH